MNIDYGLKSLKTGYINWGPYVMKSQMEDSIVKKLLKEGKSKNLLQHSFSRPFKLSVFISKSNTTMVLSSIKPLCSSI